MSIDVVIPTHEKDLNTLNICIDYARKNVIDLNKIYYVSRNKLTDKAIWISEEIFPFTLEEVSEKVGKHWRTCWYYSGLIHSISSIIIPNIKKYVLIIDSDTIIIKPTKFIDDNISLFNISPRDGLPCYYEHLFKLIPSLKKQHRWSGICHHIVINREILDDMIKRVEKIHKKSYWDAYIDVTLEPYNSLGEKTYKDVIGKHKSGQGRATFYELYFTFALQYHKNKVKIRKLNSILGYKGFLGFEKYTKSERSTTNSNKLIQILPHKEEEHFKFKNIDESLRYIVGKCFDKGFDMVSFHNHTRIGHIQHKIINDEYIIKHTN